ncbi:MAG: hypothetical protein ACI4S3_03735 [Candidatus Gastranaerophilaceae bacterium]
MSIKLEMNVSIEDIEKVLKALDIKENADNDINIQQLICNNIKSKVAKNSSMKIEQEEVLEDNSVLLTISI